MAKKTNNSGRFSKNKNSKKSNTSGSQDQKRSLFERLLSDDELSLKKIPHEKWISIGVLTIFSVVALFHIHQRVDELDDFILISDEIVNHNALQSIEEIGLPYLKGHPDEAIYDESLENKFLYFQYGVELYLRAPIFMLRDKLPNSWRSWSSLIYFYLILAIIFFFAIKSPKPNISPLFIGFFVLFIGLSYWTSSSFHYVRYYPFLLMSVGVCQVLALRMFLNLSHKPLNRYLKTFGLALIPIFFHMTNIVFLGLWMFIIFIEILVKYRDQILKSPLKVKLISVLSILLGGSMAIWIIYSNRGLINLSFDLSPILGKFFDLCMDTSPIGIFIQIIVLAGGLFSLFVLPLIERKALLLSILFFFAGLLIFSMTMGGKYIGYFGYNRYLFSAYIYYLLAAAFCIYAIVRRLTLFLNEKSRPFAWGLAPLSIGLLFIFSVFSLHTVEKKEYDFSIVPQFKNDFIENLKTQLEGVDYITFCASDLAWHFREKPRFAFNKIPEPLINAENGAVYGKRAQRLVVHDGFTKNIYALPRINNTETLCKVLQKYSTETILFIGFSAAVRNLDGNLKQGLANTFNGKGDIFTTNRTTLQGLFCK